MKGVLGVAEDTSHVSIACRQVGPIRIAGELKEGERVFDEQRSLVFKTLQVVRFFDRERNVLVYVAYSDRILTGSPQNSISTVPVMPFLPFCRSRHKSPRTNGMATGKGSLFSLKQRADCAEDK